MKRSLYSAAVFGLGWLLLVVAVAPATAQNLVTSELSGIDLSDTSSGRHISLPQGKARIITLPVDVRDVLVSNPEVADVVVKTQRTIYLLGRETGATNAFFFDAEGNELLRLEIAVQLDVEAVNDALSALMPGIDVRARAVNNNLFLSGTVRSPDMAENARKIATRFVEEDEDVVNMLAVVEDQQVLLQVRVAEVSRNVLKELGANLFDSITGNFTTITSGDLFTRTFTQGASVETPFLNQLLRYDNGNGDVLTLVINALERNGLIRTLAEPNLTAISGETANFLAGGEFPIPVSQDEDTITVEFRQFGIGLNFTPVVLNSGRISLRISTEVSSLTNEGAVTLQSITIPALTVRRAETTVELPSGGSLMIAGLMQEDMTNGVDGVPGIKDVPVLGPFFRNNALQRTERELVVTVTSYLVKPVDRSVLSLPTAGLTAPTDFDLYFLGRLHGAYTKTEAAPSATALQGPIGYILQ